MKVMRWLAAVVFVALALPPLLAVIEARVSAREAG